jgi:hypothetical protein
MSEYLKLKPKKSKTSFVEFMMNSPLHGLELEFERDKSLPRDQDLFAEK